MPAQILEGSSYHDRRAEQLKKWAAGESVHNVVDDECCPDFSCCQKKYAASPEMRKTFVAADQAGQDITKFLGEFLTESLSANYPEKNVHVTTGDNASPLN